MPEPRDVHMGGEVIIGYDNGKRAESWNEYGHRPWQRGFKDEERDARESKALERFKAEWAVMQGPTYRGTSFRHHLKSQDEPYVMPAEFHQHYVAKAKKFNRRR